MNKKILAIIPARGGSKGVLKKNIQYVGNKPLIYYPLKSAEKCSLINDFFLSTDCREIASVAQEMGFNVPFLRPDNISEDNSSDLDVIKHVIDYYRDTLQIKHEIIVYLRPTSPFKNLELIEKVVNKLIKNKNLNSVRTVSKGDGVNHPYWMFKKTEKNVLIPFITDIDVSKFYQRQLLPECYKLNGVVDVFYASNIKKYNNMYGDQIGMVEVDSPFDIDIDNKEDLEYANFLMNKYKTNYYGI